MIDGSMGERDANAGPPMPGVYSLTISEDTFRSYLVANSKEASIPLLAYM